MSGDNFMGGIAISPNMKRVKEMINTNGDVIDPETKVILEKNDPGYIPTKAEIEAKINIPSEPVKPPVNFVPETKPQSNLTIQQQIEEAEKHLVNLKLKKKEEIAKRKAELAELEKE